MKLNASRSSLRWIGVALVLVVIAGAGAAETGEPLSALLDQVRAQGVRIVYSEQVVHPEMVVIEPIGSAPDLAMVERALAHYGLKLRRLNSGVYVVGKIGPRQSRVLEEIVVTPDRFPLVAGQTHESTRVDRDQLDRTPLRMGETMSIADTLPGVAIGSEEAAPRIRGSSGRDVLVLMDGLELYEPFHLPDFRSPVSLVDPDAVDTLEIFTGGMPVEYGDRNGGLVRIETPAGASSASRALTVGSANSRISWGGALPRDGYWAAWGRMWYPNASWKTVNIGDDDVEPRMADLFGKVQFQLGERSTLGIHALGANDSVEFTSAEGDESVVASVSSRYVWGRWVSNFSDGHALETVLGFGRIRRERDGFEFGENGIDSTVSDLRRLRFASLSQRWQRRLGERHLLRAGYELRVVRADYDYRSVLVEDEEVEETRFLLRPSGRNVAFYISDRARLGDSVVLELGARWDTQSYTNDQEFSPRLNLVWRGGERSVFRLSAGRYTQSQRIHELEVQDGVGEFTRSQVSDQASAAWEGVISNGWHARIGSYVRKLHRLRPRFENLFSPVELFPEIERDRARIDAVKARSAGLELSAESPIEGRRVWGRVAYTLSRVEDRENGRWVPRSWDQRHAVSATLGFRLGSASGLAVTVYNRSGWPTTPPEVILDEGPSLDAVRNSQRLSAFFRMDARYSYRFEWPRTSLRLDVAVSNLTDRNNVCCVEAVIDDESGELEVLYDPWTGIAPVVSLTWEF